MKHPTIILQFLIIGSLVSLGGCDSPTHEVQYRSELVKTPPPKKSVDSRYPFYNPTGDAAYSYAPVYDPVDRPSTYTPGTPGYEYSYYYSDTTY